MPSYTQAVLTPDPLYLQTKSYDARADRKVAQDIIAPGVVGVNDYLVTFVSGMTVQIAAGVAYVLGQNIADQGLYRQYVAASTQLTVTAANGSNPRIDQVILRVLDAAADSNTSNAYETRIEIVPGTPTAGATLVNRSGAASLTSLLEQSKSVLLLGDILVGAGVTNLSSAVIADRRPYAARTKAGSIPRLTSTQMSNIFAPFDQQQILLQLDASAGTAGVNWMFEYNASSSSAYKWEFIGGPPLTITVDTDESSASATYVDLATVGPQIQLQRGGDYLVRFGAESYHSAANGNTYVSPKKGAAATSDNDGLALWGSSSAQTGAVKERLFTGMTAGDFIKLQYRVILAGTGNWRKRTLSILPVRIA